MLLLFALAACLTGKEAACEGYELISQPYMKELRLLADGVAGTDPAMVAQAKEQMAERGRRFSAELRDFRFRDSVMRGKATKHREMLEQYPGLIMDMDAARHRGDWTEREKKMKTIASFVEQEFVVLREVRAYCGGPKE